MQSFPKTKLKNALVIATALVLGGAVWTLHPSSAAAIPTNEVYLSPASASAAINSTFTVDLRANPDPSQPVSVVHSVISYDASKLSLQGVDCTGSPFTPQPSSSLGCPTSGNPLTLTGADFDGEASDSFVARLTFKALAGSGTSQISLSGDMLALSSGNSTGPASANSIISFTTPTTPSCATGQTGTYPNCVTPGGGGSTKSTGSSGGSTKSTGGSSSGSSTKSTGGTSAPTQTTTSGSGTATVTGKQLQFSAASFTTTSTTPTQVYIQFGTAQNSLTQQTALSDLGTSHTVTIDPSQLTPGQTYYYVVVSKTQAGVTTQTPVDTFTLNGLTVRVGVFDKNSKPFKKQSITLHSNPSTATTDDKGYVTFTNVIPGTHEVQYTTGGKTYSQQISVANNVTTSGSTQSAPVQTVAVVYSTLTAAQSSMLYIWLIVGVLIVAVVAFFFINQRRNRFTPPHGMGPLSPQAVVVGGGSSHGGGFDAASSKSVETSQRLESIPVPERPSPGSTVAPGVNERDKA